jgi:hypothetical protein
MGRIARPEFFQTYQSFSLLEFSELLNAVKVSKKWFQKRFLKNGFKKGFQKKGFQKSNMSRINPASF